MGRWVPKPPIERTRKGYQLHLDEEEREVLRSLLGQLRDLLVGPPDQPVLRRLFPAAYHLPEHAEHDAEYQRLMREDLVASRLAAIEIVDEALRATGPLTEAQVMALLQAINGLRLVLGTLLDVTEELDLDDVPDDDPHVGEHHLYSFLSWLLEWTVRAVRHSLA